MNIQSAFSIINQKVNQAFDAFVMVLDDNSIRKWFLIGLILFTLWLQSPPFSLVFQWSNIPLLVLHFFQAILTVVGVYITLRLTWNSFLNKDFQLHSRYVFIITSFFLLYWLPYGLDMTDDGRRMAHSWFFFGHPNHPPTGFKLGSHLTYSIWLNLLSTPSILWARLAFVIVQAASATLIYKILKSIYTNQLVCFWATLASFFAMNILVNQTVNYNNLPVLLILLTIWLQMPLFEANIKRNSRLRLILAGLTLTYAVFCRIPFLVFFAVPAVALLTSYILNPTSRMAQLKNTLYVYFGAGIGVTLVVLVLSYWGTLDSLIASIEKNLIAGVLGNQDSAITKSLSYHGHDSKTLLSVYSKNLTDLLPRIGLLGAGMLIALITSFSRHQVIQILGAFFIFFFIKNNFKLNSFWYIDYTALLIVLAIPYLFTQRSMKWSPIWVWSIMLLFFSFMGSGNGIINTFISGGAGLILALCIAHFLIDFLPSAFTNFTNYFNPKLIGIAVVVFLVWQSTSIKKYFIYRDQTPNQLTEMFKSPSLFGVFSHASKVEQIDSILTHMNSSVKNNDQLLCVNTLPLFYYLTTASFGKIKYWRWPGEKNEIKHAFFNSSDAPDWILLSRFDTRNKRWPNSPKACIDRDLPQFQFYQDLLGGNTYILHHKTSAFTLHKRAF